MGLLRSKEGSRAEGVGSWEDPPPFSNRRAGGLRYSSETRLPKGPPQTLPLTTDTLTPTYLHTRKLHTPPWTHSHTNSWKTTQTHTHTFSRKPYTHTHALQETTNTHTQGNYTHTHTHTHRKPTARELSLEKSQIYGDL